MIETCGWIGAPVIVFDRIKMGGRMLEGPVVANPYGRWHCDALAFGLDPDGQSPRDAFRMTLDHLNSRAGDDGQWPTLAPRTVPADGGPYIMSSWRGR